MDYAYSLAGKHPFGSQLQFLRPVTTVKKSKDNLTTKLYFDVEEEENKEDVQSLPLATAKTITATLPSEI